MGRHTKKKETDENYEGELPNRKHILDYINANILTNFVIVGFGDVREPYNVEIFLESFEKMCPHRVKAIIENRFPGKRSKFDQIKSAKSGMVVISRADLDIVYSGCLNFTYFSEHWSKFDFFRRSGKELDTTHGFWNHIKGANHRNSLLNDFRQWQKKSFPLKKHYLIYNDYTGWQREVVEWYNIKLSKGFNDCRKQLFLYGGSGRGKTEFIKHLFGRFEDQTFIPVTGTFTRWQWEGFHQNIHALVLIDEFTFKDFDINRWKKITDGHSIKIELKNVSCGEMVLARLPMIMISNYPPVSNEMCFNDQEAVKRRIKSIIAVQFNEDMDFFKKRVRFIRSMDTADEPLSLEEVSALPYDFNKDLFEEQATIDQSNSTAINQTYTAQACSSGYNSIDDSESRDSFTPRAASSPRIQLHSVPIFDSSSSAATTSAAASLSSSVTAADLSKIYELLLQSQEEQKRQAIENNNLKEALLALSKNNSCEKVPVVALGNLPQRRFNFKRPHQLIESNPTTAQTTPSETPHTTLIEAAQTSSVEIAHNTSFVTAQITVSDETAPEPKRHCKESNEIDNCEINLKEALLTLSKNNSSERVPVVNLAQKKFNFKRSLQTVESNSSSEKNSKQTVETAQESKRHCKDSNGIDNSEIDSKPNADLELDDLDFGFLNNVSFICGEVINDLVDTIITDNLI